MILFFIFYGFISSDEDLILEFNKLQGDLIKEKQSIKAHPIFEEEPQYKEIKPREQDQTKTTVKPQQTTTSTMPETTGYREIQQIKMNEDQRGSWWLGFR